VYDPKTHEVVRSRLRPGDVFVDVGAKASIALWLEGSWGNGGAVVAIEPQASLRGIIEINGLNDLVQRYIYTAGLGRPGEASERERGRG
jgi:hypothetical protein